MARNKMMVEYISNEVARKASFRKRKKGIMKKLKELTILCGVEGCVVVYESKNSSKAETWPSQNARVRRVLNRFFTMSKNDQTDKMLDQRSYLKQRIKKANEQLEKKLKANREKELAIQRHEFFRTRELPENLSMDDLKILADLNDQEMKKLEAQMKEKDEEEMKKEKKTKKKKNKKMKMMSDSASSVPSP